MTQGGFASGQLDALGDILHNDFLVIARESMIAQYDRGESGRLVRVANRVFYGQGKVPGVADYARRLLLGLQPVGRSKA
jgi:hypothetical protein